MCELEAGQAAMTMKMTERLRDDRGFTLVELLVTMSILSVVMALVTGSAIFLQGSINETDQRFDDLGQTRLAMDATTKWVRSAITVERVRTGSTTATYTQPFLQARRSAVELMANVRLESGAGSGAPKRVRLDIVNGDELREQVWTGTIHSSGDWRQSGLASSRVVARGLTNTQLFTYFAEDGTALTPAGDTDLSVAQREQVRRVGIDFAVRQEPNVDVPVSELRSQVTLPNQLYFDTEAQS